MTAGYLLVAILSACVAVFALQNGEPTRIQFLAWSLDAVPVAGVILASLAIGMVLTAVPMAIQRWRLRARLRTLERQLASLERDREARDREARDRAAPPDTTPGQRAS